MIKNGDEEIDAIICNRVADRPVPAIEDSVKERCSKCGSEVWITPRTLEVRKETGAKIVCVPCILPKLDEKSEFFLAPGQVAEIADHTKKEIQKN